MGGQQDRVVCVQRNLDSLRGGGLQQWKPSGSQLLGVWGELRHRYALQLHERGLQPEYSGHPQDMYKDSINMYFNEYFMGDEEFAYQNSPVLNYDNRAQSIIVTGDQWWMIYESANYGGYKACLAPGQDNMPAFYSTMGSLHSLANDISSVAIGCYAKDKFYPDALNVTSRSAHGASGFFGGH